MFRLHDPPECETGFQLKRRHGRKHKLEWVSQCLSSLQFQDDARHVAACTVHGIGLLVSWNFKHLVNVRREAGFNGVNLLKGHPSIRIVNPLELIYEPEDQSL